MDSYIRMFKNYVNFNNRTSRKDYWLAILFNWIIAFVIGIIGNATDMSIFKVLGYLYSLATLVPGIALSIRRMHDIGKAGTWILVSFIPIAGQIWFLVLVCTASKPVGEQYGPQV